MTKEGRERKDRLISRLFFQHEKCLLILNVYASVLPLLKKYVLIFQKSEPMIHKLNDYQVQLLTEFLRCFLKPECLLNIRDTDLVNLELDDNFCRFKIFLLVLVLKTFTERQRIKI
ncbi:Uncharacterised protein at_DN2404 [Pycnogonum litorale]